MVCLLDALWVQLSVNAGNGWPHNALRHHWLMPISCHFRGCKALLVTSLTHVSGAIASVQTFRLPFTYTVLQCVTGSVLLNAMNCDGGIMFCLVRPVFCPVPDIQEYRTDFDEIHGK